MDFYEVINQRCSNRGFDQSRPVEDEKLQRILSAVQRAPTAVNNQPFKIIVIGSPEMLAKVSAVYPRSWLATAPMIMAVIGSPELAWKRLNGDSAHVIDCAIAMDHLILAAAAEGLGSCWICAYDQEQMAQTLEIPQGWEVVAITPIGYPTKLSANTSRRPLEEIVEYK